MAQINKDTLWKGAIEELFEAFCHYFFPDWAKNIADFSKKPDFLDKELHNLLPEGEQQERRADSLVRVYTKTGQEQWILIHIEVQGYKDDHFSRRMFDYFYRISDRHRDKDIMTLVIYTDDIRKFHPTKYQYQYQKTKLTYEFQTFKVLSKTEAELTIPGNPFSIVMQAVKKALLKKKQTDKEQLMWKTDLVRQLVTEGHSSDTIRSLLYFIRYYVRFEDERTDQQFMANISQILNVKQTMGLIERIIEDTRTASFTQGKAEGKAEGRAEGKTEGRSEGVEEGFHLANVKGIRNALKKGKMTIPEIAEIFEVSEEFVLKVQKGEL